VVKFDLKSDAAFSPSAPSMSRAAAADSYTISGVLEDGDLTIRLKGSYDPHTGNWSVSAKSSAVIYTLDGSVDSAGVSRGSSASIAVKNGEEWVPYVFPVTESPVSIPGAAGAEEGETGGMPPFAYGAWYSNTDWDGGSSRTMTWIISDWKIKVTSTYTSPSGSSSRNRDNNTLIECSESAGAFEIIGCYPEYVMTSANFAKAAAAYLGIDEGAITALTAEPSGGSYPSGRWIYVESSSYGSWGGFSEAEEDKLDVLLTSGWEIWAAANGVPKETRYIKFKILFTNNNTEFDMIPMVAVTDPSEPWQFTFYFDSLAALKAAAMVEAHEWEWSDETQTYTDLGVVVDTLHR
jgi:hypothetical protein